MEGALARVAHRHPTALHSPPSRQKLRWLDLSTPPKHDRLDPRKRTLGGGLQIGILAGFGASLKTGSRSRWRSPKSRRARPNAQRVEILGEAFAAAGAIDVAAKRISAMIELSSGLEGLSLSALYALWRRTLHILARRSRVDLLFDLWASQGFLPQARRIGSRDGNYTRGLRGRSVVAVTWKSGGPLLLFLAPGPPRVGFFRPSASKAASVSTGESIHSFFRLAIIRASSVTRPPPVPACSWLCSSCHWSLRRFCSHRLAAAVSGGTCSRYGA